MAISQSTINEFSRFYYDYFDKRYAEFTKSANKLIDDFYADYTPRFYLRSREYSLYDFVSVELTNISLDSENMTNVYHEIDDIRRMGAADPEYIYKMTFEDGYHGGFARGHSKNYKWRMPKKINPLRFYSKKSAAGKRNRTAARSTPLEISIRKEWESIQKKYVTRGRNIIKKIKQEASK